MTDYITVAKITRTRGIRGEVAAEILTDFPERFSNLDRVRVASTAVEFWEEIEAFWFHKGRVILKFKGRDRPHEVEELVGCDVQIPESERVVLPEDTYFDSDLEGCTIRENDRILGRVIGILKASGSHPTLVVRTDEGDEFMIPAVRQFLKGIDTGEKVIEVELPPGLVELTIDRENSRKKK